MMTCWLEKDLCFQAFLEQYQTKGNAVFAPSLLPEERGRELEGSVNMLRLTGSLGEGRGQDR